MHTGFPVCCVLFYTYVWYPIKEHKVRFNRGLTFHLKEKSVKGFVSLGLENLKQLHRNFNHRFHGGSYFGCPRCVIKNHYVELKKCTHLRVAGSHKEDDMSAWDAFVTGYLEGMWLDYETASLTEKQAERLKIFREVYITGSIKDVANDVFNETFLPNFYMYHYDISKSFRYINL